MAEREGTPQLSPAAAEGNSLGGWPCLGKDLYC